MLHFPSWIFLNFGDFWAFSQRWFFTLLYVQTSVKLPEWNRFEIVSQQFTVVMARLWANRRGPSLRNQRLMWVLLQPSVLHRLVFSSSSTLSQGCPCIEVCISTFQPKRRHLTCVQQEETLVCRQRRCKYVGTFCHQVSTSRWSVQQRGVSVWGRGALASLPGVAQPDHLHSSV